MSKSTLVVRPKTAEPESEPQPTWQQPGFSFPQLGSVAEGRLKEILEILPLQSSMSLLRDGIIAFHGITVPEHLKLPHGYGYKGGVARELLRAALKLPDSLGSIRDLDVVRLQAICPDYQLDEAVAQQFMPEDYACGHGVESIFNIDDYLKSRDITLNEVLWSGDTLYASLDCVTDTLRGILRFSAFELDVEEECFNDKLLAKVFRLQAEAAAAGELLAIAAMPYQVGISAFHIALHLDRALAKGEDVAQRYLAGLSQAGYALESWVGEDGLHQAVNDLA
jgi:hypothetical protein